MKPNHKLTLLMVSVTTFNAVCFSACGDFIAAIYALGCAGLLIGLAKTEDRFYRTATLLQESIDRWSNSIKFSRELIGRHDRKTP